jgi:hypothetical protein
MQEAEMAISVATSKKPRDHGQGYDLIGDIHGHADALQRLLRQLGYSLHKGFYKHPERQAIFLGDFIDRGPQIREALEIVRPMIDSGAALSVMGNHELNALAFHTPDPAKPGDHLRPHNEKNSNQHAETMRQVPAGELVSYLNWFRTLPMWLDLDGLRVVHACWDGNMIGRISGPVTDDFLHSACRKDESLFKPVETILKGKEAALPEGLRFRDKDGHLQTSARVRWYSDPTGQTYRTYAMSTEHIDCDLPLAPSVVEEAVPYPPAEKPVFIGHYWMKGEKPELLAPNVACVDWSVAKGGFLCAYQWNGEGQLQPENFVYESPRTRE